MLRHWFNDGEYTLIRWLQHALIFSPPPPLPTVVAKLLKRFRHRRTYNFRTPARKEVRGLIMRAIQKHLKKKYFQKNWSFVSNFDWTLFLTSLFFRQRAILLRHRHISVWIKTRKLVAARKNNTARLKSREKKRNNSAWNIKRVESRILLARKD